MAEYCTRADMYDFGLPRGSFPNPARLVSSASAATNTLILGDHGFDLNAPVVFRADQGANAALPDPLVAGTEYYAIPVSDSAFQVAATPDGAAIELTTDGVRTLVVAKLSIDAAIRAASALVDDMLPAHVVPLTAPYPTLIVVTTAELATAKLLGSTGARSTSFSEVWKEARQRLQRWARGVPVRGDHPQRSANLAMTGGGSLSAATDPRGWGRYGGIGGCQG